MLLTERDLSVFFIPLRLFWVDAIKGGGFPLWNPYYYSGIPLLATLQPAVFYPLNILLLILPFDLAFNWIIILHFFLSGVFIFLLVRELEASIIGALISALIFMLSGYLISVHNLLSTLLSVTWVPLIIFLFLRAIKRSSLNYMVLTGITLAIMFTGGGIEVVYGTLGLLLFLALLPETFLNLSPKNSLLSCQNVSPIGTFGDKSIWHPSSNTGFPSPPVPLIEGDKETTRVSPASENEARPKNCASIKKRVTYLFLSVAIFLLLSAVQLIPFLELSHYSIRASGLSYQEVTIWSMDLKDLIQFFIPDPYGYGTSEEKYWSNQSWLKTIYVGTIPFILSAFFFAERGRKPLPFLLLLLFSFTLAFGKNSAIYEYLYYYFPTFNKIRYPVKFLFLVFILFSISAGLGWDSLKQNLEQTRKSGKWIIFTLLCLATVAAIVFGWLSYFDKEVKEVLIENGIKYPEYNDVNINVFNTKRLLVIFIIAVLILYSALRFVKARKVLPYLIVSLLTIDLFFAHYGYYFATKTDNYHKSSESMNFILKDKTELFRVFTTPKTKKGEVIISTKENSEIKEKKNSSTNDIKTMNVGIDKEIISGYNLERRIFDIEGVEVMRLSDYEKVSTLLTTAPGPDATNLLALLNVKYVLSTPKIESKEFMLVKIIRPVPGKTKKELEEEDFLKIYQNLNYLPRAFLVAKHRIVTKEGEYKAIMQSKEFKPVKEVLLYEEPWDKEGLESRVQSEGLIKTRNKNNKKQDEVSIVDYRNNSVRLSVNTDRPKILVLSETYYPGWKAYVDGQEKKILKANLAFRAIPLSAGQHEVSFIYDPLSFKVGLMITLLTIACLTVFGIAKAVYGKDF